MDVKKINPSLIAAYTQTECERAFVLILRELLRILKCKVRTESDRALVDRCEKRIALVVLSGAGELLRISKDKLIENRERIMSRDEEYFMTQQLVDTAGASAADDIINLVRTQYSSSTKPERDLIYSHFVNMLMTCIRHVTC
jgi:hypothetical protein